MHAQSRHFGTRTSDAVLYSGSPQPYSANLLALMGIPERTRSRRRHEGFLKPDEADRLLRIGRVFEEAIRVFGSEEKAAGWLKTPSPVFEDSAPLAYLVSDAGAQAVSEEIVRIDFGDFA